MAIDTNLQFIREKIRELRNAIMYVTSNGLVKLGNDIVTALKVDEEGQLWFITNRPSYLLEEVEQSFPVRLFFYRKGVNFYIEVSGKATIVNTMHAIGKGKDRDTKHSEKVLIRMAMTNIEYTEPLTKRPKKKIEIFAENCYDWFLRNVAVSYNQGSVLKRLRQSN